MDVNLKSHVYLRFTPNWTVKCEPELFGDPVVGTYTYDGNTLEMRISGITSSFQPSRHERPNIMSLDGALREQIR
jgi:hypothetical protein